MRYWNDVLEPYVRNADVFRCPSHRATPQPYWSYGWSYDLGSGVSVGSVADASATILAGEVHGLACPISYPSRTGPSASLWYPDPRHQGLAIFLFCDGHCKALKPEATESPENLWDP